MLIPIILSGGAGTRLWPISRETHPKPFMRLNDGESLLQKTRNRVDKIISAVEILTVTNQDFYFKTKEEYAQLSENLIKDCFILEPFGRNTAPAINLAAFYVAEKYGPESVLLIIPADHLIEDQIMFENLVEYACAIAKKNNLVTFGIKPRLPETGYGYIKLDKLYDENNAYTVAEFVEKPSIDLAKTYYHSGLYLWNSGIFCFKTTVILDQFKIHAPKIFKVSELCWDISKKNCSELDVIKIDADAFYQSENVSIDYAVMEKAENVVVIPCHFTWTDIGSWDAMSDLVNPDQSGNCLVSETLLLDVTNSFIQSHDKLVAAIGVDNLVIVDTPDALLISDRHRSQDVKKIVSQLKQKNHDAYKAHRAVTRPWGMYTVLEQGDHFKIKKIIVKPGAALSLQMHLHRSEHWVVVSGLAKVTNGENIFMLNMNESTFIPAGHKHRLENPGITELVLIEVQTGEYLGEDDIVRYNDDYGRL